MKKRGIILLLAAVLLLPVCMHAQYEFSVMSYNIRLDVASDGENRWDARKDKVAGLMNYHGADFIGCQEVQHHQLQYLNTELKNYAYIGVGRDDGKEGGEYSCIFYRKDKYQLLEHSTFWLSATPDSVSFGWDAACRRVCTYGLFKSKTGNKFWVFNTHLDHIGVTARRESAKLILEKINEVNTKHYPVVLTGDFNSKPEDEPVKIITSALQNSRSVSQLVYGSADTWEAFKFHEKPYGCIDYIFTSPGTGITVTKFATITDSYDLKYPSDHLPVMATLQLTK